MECLSRSSILISISFSICINILLILTFLCILFWQEIQHKDEDIIRALFERAVSLSLPPKKMKVCEHIYITNFADVFSSQTHVEHCCFDWQFLFKKYLDYEKSQGDDERIESVKRKAMEYVESTMSWCKVMILRQFDFVEA